MEAFNRPHLLLYRLDRPLDPLAVFEVRTPEGAVLGRAVEVCSSAGLRALKRTRLRQASPLVLRVEGPDGTPAFTLERGWDWWGTKPVRVLRPGGSGLIVLRREGRVFLRTRVETPDGRTLATVHALQRWLLWDLRYELRDPQKTPLAHVCWFVGSWWSSFRHGEVRVQQREASPPWPVVALAVALYLGLGIARR
ncbi:MAG: hypothetical protein ACK45F_00445 [bacterium]